MSRGRDFKDSVSQYTLSNLVSTSLQKNYVSAKVDLTGWCGCVWSVCLERGTRGDQVCGCSISTTLWYGDRMISCSAAKIYLVQSNIGYVLGKIMMLSYIPDQSIGLY